MIPLRPYQREGVQAVRARIHAGKRRIVFVLPTGGGKTVVASSIVESAREKGSRILFCAHRRELIKQTTTKLFRMGIPHDQVGVIMAGTPARAGALFGASPLDVMAQLRERGTSDPQIDCELWGLFGARRPQAPVQVASIDTARGKELGDFDLIIIDEAHRALAKGYRDLVAKYPRAVILGLTATPYRADGKGLGELFDDLVPIATPRQLVEMGFLVEPRIFTVPASALPDLSKVSVSGGDYNAEELESAVDTSRLIGDLVDHWQRRAAGQRTVVFAASVKHSKNITERFCAAGVRAEHLDGETPTPDRDAILARLERGETLVVSNCGVLCEGWDMPIVSCAVLARPTMSEGLYLQQAGRILRPHPGKPGALILDHAGCVVEHNGGPIEEREFSLLPPKKKRRKGVAEEEVRTKTCPRCFAIVPAAVRTCPEVLPDGTPCGHVFVAQSTDQVDEEAGELVELRPATREEKRAAWDRLCAERGKRRPSWVRAQFLEAYGVKAPKTWKVPLRAEETDQGNPEVMSVWRELYRDAYRTGRKPGFAAWQFKERFGHWPVKALREEQAAYIAGEGRDLAEQLEAAVQAAQARNEAVVAAVFADRPAPPPPAPPRRRMRIPALPDTALEVYAV